MNSPKKLAVMALWRRCFEDSEAFVQWYFERKYRERNALLVRDERGEAMAALQLLPYRMTFAGGEIDTMYLSGACTRPEDRKRGVMTRLLRQALREARGREVPLVTLIPQEEWLFAYYRRVGFVSVFEHSLEAYEVDPTSGSGEEAETLPLERVTTCFPYFAARMGERGCCVQHDAADFVDVAEDLYRDGGRLFSVREGEQVRGLAFARPTPEGVWVSEWLYDTEEVRGHLLHRMAAEWEEWRVVARTLPKAGRSRPSGMARIVDVPRLLEYYAARNPALCWTVQVTDPLLPQNSGLFRLERGMLITGGDAGREMPPAMGVEELTAWLLCQSSGTPFISLMLE